ncbi:MAG: GNAT family N-acetyltransferase, partial [Actinomycetota bacterium]|nr:GNAT family N-acetyltransferase [Actinomycetota bacterium]
MHRLYGDPRVMRAFDPSGPWSLNQTAERVAEIVRHWERHRFGRYHMRLRESGEFVGRGGLEHDEDLGALDLGYSLLPQWWGRGLATEAGRAFIREAFTELGAELVVAVMMPANTRSIRVAERLGFVPDRDVIRDGTLCRSFTLSRDHWVQRAEPEIQTCPPP